MKLLITTLSITLILALSTSAATVFATKPTDTQIEYTTPQSGPDEGDNRHPSGKDRSVEHGNSGTQGKSNSDPDKMENAFGGNNGKDKPSFDGGLDKADQDGNNGCGNDDDFEDDNNGNCHKQKEQNPTNPKPTVAFQNPKNNEKNPGGCDQNGSNGDKNGKPCNPGKNHASPRGCERGEPDCVKQEVKPTTSPAPSPTVTVTPTVTTTPTPTTAPQQNTKEGTVLGTFALPITGNANPELFQIVLTICLWTFGAGVILKTKSWVEKDITV